MKRMSRRIGFFYSIFQTVIFFYFFTNDGGVY